MVVLQQSYGILEAFTKANSMYLFLIPLLIGFVCNTASAFTTAFSKRWGQSRGSLITFILRNILGIPVWALGYLLAVQTSATLFFETTPTSKVIGWLFIIAGGAIILIALISIRARAGAPSVSDSLVRTGLYKRVRHPIHAGTILEFAGIFLLFPTQAVALACGLGVVWVMIQTKCEEHDLMQRLPEYREYMHQVPRFLPRLRIKR
jgi:protein-S-isoprenylcysteine O-methyltransferase Ste14